MVIIALTGALSAANVSVAQDGTDANSSQRLFIDQRRLPGDGEKATLPPPPENTEEQKKLDALAARLKAEEEELASREAEARKKFEELKRLSDEVDNKRKLDEDQLRAREAEARKEVEEAKRLADEARAKLQEELQKQSAQKIEDAPAASPATPPGSGTGATAEPPRAALNIPAIALTCPDGVLSTEPLPGGRSKISVQSPCRRGQTVSLQYGPITTQRPLDDQGSTQFVVDMFLGADAETSIAFNDGKRQPARLAPGDLDQVTKVAVVWNAPVNLDLHAFEYAAAAGEPGDVWSGAPRDASSASALVTQDGRGHGFMSSTNDGKGIGSKAEVFTFLRSRQQKRGAVAMALDYETRGSDPVGDTCGNGQYAQVSIEVIVREAGGAMSRQDGIIPALTCGKPLSTDARYQTGVVPDIRIHNN